MLVVVSDLHFEEEVSDHIVGDGTHPPIVFSRNLGPKAYYRFILMMAAEAVRNGAKRLDLVFAGDIFDVNRTALWFQNEQKARPYSSTDDTSPALETVVLKIMRAIAQEPEINKTLQLFQLLGKGRYLEGSEEKEFPVPVIIHHIAGNHDRMVNATPAIRRTVRELLGMTSSGAPFPRVLTFEAERAIVRHGHEYDRHNFGLDLSETTEIPLHLPEAAYTAAPFGDFATIDIVSRFSHLFRQHHGDNKILASRTLRTVYLRLLEFDDLRPQRALLNYVLHMPEEGMSPVTVWKTIEPVIYRLLEEVHNHPFLEFWLDKMDKKWRLDAIDAIQGVLDGKLWRLTGIPLGLAQFISNTAIGGYKEESGPHYYAAREQAIRSGEYQFLVGGHTHTPAVELIAADRMGERYYIDSGTWRNRVPATPDFKAFGRLKALTYVMLYGPDEDLGTEERPKLSSVDFWSGVTQRWLHDA
jgi:predicted phosphodiesterase